MTSTSSFHKRIMQVGVAICLLTFLLIAGCSQNNEGDVFSNQNQESQTLNQYQRPPSGSGRNWQNGQGPSRIANLIDEQRAAMMQQRFESMKIPCAGKNDGEICVMTNPRGDRQGNCTFQNETLICSIGRPEGMINRSFDMMNRPEEMRGSYNRTREQID